MHDKGVATEDLRRLLVLNRTLVDAVDYSRMLEIESCWIGHLLQGVSRKPVTSYAECHDYIATKIKTEAEDDPTAVDYVSHHCNKDAFAEVVRQFALDGLIEAQSFFGIIPQLPIEAQMPVMRIFIDEFGCGNIEQSHSILYKKLLVELGLPTVWEDYLGTVNREMYEFVNVFYWAARRAPSPEYFLGGLAYFEAVVPTGFQCYLDACQRLGIVNSKYFSEHIHIDMYHARDAMNAIAELEKYRWISWQDVVVGIDLIRDITSRAFVAAVKSAMLKEGACA